MTTDSEDDNEKPKWKETKAERLKNFLEMAANLEIPPCAFCGRIVLAGHCCNGPHAKWALMKALASRVGKIGKKDEKSC